VNAAEATGCIHGEEFVERVRLVPHVDDGLDVVYGLSGNRQQGIVEYILLSTIE
jgi:hypothetical protein